MSILARFVRVVQSWVITAFLFFLALFFRLPNRLGEKKKKKRKKNAKNTHHEAEGGQVV